MQSSRGRILFVENHRDTAEMMIVMMQLWGYEVLHAFTVSDALKLARQGQFNLFLFEHMLPDGTGIDLCIFIREFDPKTPIMFYSASAYSFEIEKAMAAGAQAYVTKPADPVVLEKTISGLVKAQ